MSITAQQLVALRGPQFSGDPRINDLIAYYAAKLSAEYFGDVWGEAVGLRVLHQLTLESMSRGSSSPGAGTSAGVVAGGVASISEGELSISFRTPTSTLSQRDSGLSSTQFGLELLSLMRENYLGPLNRMV
jgi:hypothetical protein